MSEEVRVEEQMYNAVTKGDLPAFERLLNEHPELFRYPDGRCMWLSDAASAGQLEIVKFLVGRGADVNEPADLDSVPSPENVVKRAAARGHVHVVEWLLDQGAELNYTIGDQVRCEALTGAAYRGHLSVVQLLAERGAALNCYWAETTPLDHAINGGDEEVVQYLRLLGAKTYEELEEFLK